MDGCGLKGRSLKYLSLLPQCTTSRAKMMKIALPLQNGHHLVDQVGGVEQVADKTINNKIQWNL